MGSSFGTLPGGVNVGATWCVRLHDGWAERGRGSKYLEASNRFLFPGRFSLINELRRGLGLAAIFEAHSVRHASPI
jgi:hypothetical protein